MAELVAAVLDAPAAAATWRERLLAALAEWPVTLAPAGDDGFFVEVDTQRSLYGQAWLLDRDELAARHPGCALLDWTPMCPFLAGLAVVGYVTWLELDPWQRSSWVVPLVKLGKGALAPAEGGPVRPAIVEREFDLGGNLGKFGFDDGDVLLTRDMEALGDYRGACWRVIQAALAARGLELHVYGPETTCHNVFRVGSPLRVGGRTIDDEAAIRRALHGVDVRLWVYDLELARDVALFGA
jgi:hypothetical protein